MKKFIGIILILGMLFGCTSNMTTEGSFNYYGDEDPVYTTTTTTSTTTTTTLPSYKERWQPRPVEKPTPFEIDEPTWSPKGCTEGVDC